MKAVKFKGHNTILAKDQPQFNNLPAFFEPEGTEGRSVVYCYELTFEEIQTLISTRRIFGLQQIGAGGFNPVSCFVNNPLFEDPVEEVPEEKVTVPSPEQVQEMTKIEEVEFESEDVIHKDLQIKVDETFTLVLKKDEHEIFMRHANQFLEKNEWFEIQDTTGKAFYFQLRKLTKDHEAFFESEFYEIELDYLNIWVVNRFARIAQIEINEENEEQKFFQGIVTTLFDLI